LWTGMDGMQIGQHVWSVWPYRSWRHLILIESLKAAPFMWNCRMCRCDVVANAGASAGSYGQRIERAEGFAQGKWCASRYPTLARAQFQRSTSLALFLRPNELAPDPWRVRKLRKEPLAAEHPEATALDGPDGGTG
jgi:hypothetical protein